VSNKKVKPVDVWLTDAERIKLASAFMYPGKTRVVIRCDKNGKISFCVNDDLILEINGPLE
jgi:hypothetical protein